MTDQDGLQLYRCFRGTNMTESMHQSLASCFGHTRAGPQYSDCLLAVVRHRFNWRASERNRPNFPQARHYNGCALDTVNELYEMVFGHPKYPHWIHYNEVAADLEWPAYGIVPLTEEDASVFNCHPVSGSTKSLRYLALRQQVPVP